MQKSEQKMEIEEIIDKAFDYFDRYVDRKRNLNNVLLEELEPIDDVWIVAISFDGKRQEYSEPAGLGALSSFGNKTTKTVREVRRIYLDSAGNFQKIA